MLEAKKYVSKMTQIQLVKYLELNGEKQLDEMEKNCSEQYGMSLDEYFRAFPGAAEEMPYKNPYYWAGFILQGDINRQ